MHRLLPGGFASLLIAAVLTLFVALPAHAADLTIAVVDFQKALNEIDEGATAMARFEGMRDEKMKNIERMRQNIVEMQKALEGQASILSESALADKQNALAQAQMEFQQAAYTSEQELQSSYMTMVDDLVSKMREVAAKIAQEQGFDLVLEYTESGVVHHSSDVADLTDQVVKRYNARQSQ